MVVVMLLLCVVEFSSLTEVTDFPAFSVCLYDIFPVCWTMGVWGSLFQYGHFPVSSVFLI